MILEEKEFRSTLHREFTEKEFHRISIHKTSITCYRGNKAKAPAWIDQDPGSYIVLVNESET